MTLKKSFPLWFAQQSPPGLCSQLLHYFQSRPFYLWIDGGVLARETADLQSGSLPPTTQRNTTQPGAISGGAANIGGKTAFEPRRLPEEILSAGDISVCGRDLRAALPHYLLWLPVLHFLPLPLLPLILNSTAAGPAPPPPPPPPWLKTSAPF